MKIYFNGDSHTSGSEIFDLTKVWSTMIAKKLNATWVKNDAIGGNSNTRILDSTKDFLSQCKLHNNFPDFIFIGLSEYSRIDWYHNGKYLSANSQVFLPEEVNSVDPEREYYRKEYMSLNPLFASTMAVYFQNEFYNLHCELLDLKIPHLFFNGIVGIYDVMNITKNTLLKAEVTSKLAVYHHDWKDMYYKPYDLNASYVDFCKDRNFTPTQWYHYPQLEAQQAWCDNLYTYITEKKLVQP